MARGVVHIAFAINGQTYTLTVGEGSGTTCMWLRVAARGPWSGLWSAIASLRPSQACGRPLDVILASWRHLRFKRYNTPALC